MPLMPRSNLCYYSDLYIIVKGSIDLLAAFANKNNKTEKDMFKNNTPFRSFISAINNSLIVNAKDLDIFMSI